MPEAIVSLKTIVSKQNELEANLKNLEDQLLNLEHKLQQVNDLLNEIVG